MTSDLFERRFEKTLLKKQPQKRVIIMDNAAFHKKEVLQNLAKKYSQTLIFLPPYLPVCTSIEHTWSALKRNIEYPEGGRKLMKLIAGGDGTGEIRLYKCLRKDLELIEHARIGKALCEFGQPDDSGM